MYPLFEIKINIHIYYSGNEHWIGLEKIYYLTNRPGIPMKLHIRMEDVSGNVKDAYYDTFRVEDEVCSTIISTLSSWKVNEPLNLLVETIFRTIFLTILHISF